MLACTLLISNPAPGQTEAPPSPPPPEAVLRDPAADRAARAAAVDALLAAGPDGEQALRAALETPLTDGLDRLLVLEAIARSSTPPASLWSAVASAASALHPDPSAAFPAIAAFRTREAARVLSGAVAADLPAGVRAAACAALARLTGRDDLGADAARWIAWEAETEPLSDAEWQQALVRRHSARADRLNAEAQSLRQQLAQVYRKYYVQLPAAERPTLLAELLVHESEDLRAVGFDLTRRELSSGQRLNGEVTGAALRLLEDRSPQSRERAAMLVDLLAPADALPEVAEALEAETDPRAAAAMLTAAARWPAPQTWAPVVRWLAETGPARAAAAQTALALLREGFLPADPERARSLEILRAVPLRTLGPNSLRLLAALGGDGDRAGIAELLLSPDPGVRLAAADALAPRAEYLDRILDAASRDPALFAAAASATVNHRRTGAGYWAIDALVAPSEQQKADELLKIAAALPIADLVTVGARISADPVRERVLSRLTSAPNTEEPATLSTGLLLLAESRLALGQADGALTALDALPSVAQSTDAERTLALRTAALLMLGRLEPAESLDAPAEAWLQGLRRCSGLPHAQVIIEAIRRLFGDSLSPDQFRLLSEIETQITATSPPPSDGGPLTNGGPE